MAQLVAREAAADRQARKTALLEDIAQGEANITLLIDAATAQFNAQRRNNLNIDFNGDEGELDAEDDGDEGEGEGGEGEGEGGEGGDGADLSPIAGIICNFSLQREGATVFDAALDDFLRDGVIEREDL